MKKKQLESVLLILSKRNGQVVHVLCTSPELQVHVRYTAILGDNNDQDDDIRFSERKIRPSSDLVRRHVQRSVDSLKFLNWGDDKIVGSDWRTEVSHNGAWFNLAVRPLKSGPTCFVDHVVL